MWETSSQKSSGKEKPIFVCFLHGINIGVSDVTMELLVLGFLNRVLGSLFNPTFVEFCLKFSTRLQHLGPRMSDRSDRGMDVVRDKEKTIRMGGRF
jgi:hypothetical protein